MISEDKRHFLEEALGKEGFARLLAELEQPQQTMERDALPFRLQSDHVFCAYCGSILSPNLKCVNCGAVNH